MSDSAPTSLSLVFSPEEDRLVLLLGSRPTGLLLTRRLTGRLVNGLASVLEQSSLPARSAPTDLRDSIISMEHQGATTAPPGAAPAPVPLEQGLALHLVTTVNIAVQPSHFALTINATGMAPLPLSLSRGDLHRLIELFTRQADLAGWNLPIDAAWLTADTALLTIN